MFYCLLGSRSIPFWFKFWPKMAQDEAYESYHNKGPPQQASSPGRDRPSSSETSCQAQCRPKPAPSPFPAWPVEFLSFPRRTGAEVPCVRPCLAGWPRPTPSSAKLHLTPCSPHGQLVANFNHLTTLAHFRDRKEETREACWGFFFTRHWLYKRLGIFYEERLAKKRREEKKQKLIKDLREKKGKEKKKWNMWIFFFEIFLFGHLKYVFRIFL